MKPLKKMYMKQNKHLVKICFQIAIDRLRNPDKGKGSDVLLIAVLNAYMASTFRPDGKDQEKIL
jgi:hypothetical protein